MDSLERLVGGKKVVRGLMLAAAFMLGAFGILAFTFQQSGVSQDVLFAVAGVLAYGYLAAVLGAIVLAQVRRRRAERGRDQRL